MRKPYPKSIQKQVVALAHGEGEEPLRFSLDDLKALGHEPMGPQKAIRRFCISCMGGETQQDCKTEIALCTSVGCPLWPFRYGKSPWSTNATGAKERIVKP